MIKVELLKQKLLIFLTLQRYSTIHAALDSKYVPHHCSKDSADSLASNEDLS